MTAASNPLVARRERALAHRAAREQHAAERLARAAAGRVRRSDDELRQVVADGIALLTTPSGAEAGADEVAAWAAEQFGDLLAVACSMADTVLPHLVATYAPWVDVLFLETGYHFPETVGTRDAAEVSMPITVVDVLPERTVAEQDAAHGPRLYERDPALCCQLRKVDRSTACSAGTRPGSPACAATRHPRARARRSSRGTPRTAS